MPLHLWSHSTRPRDEARQQEKSSPDASSGDEQVHFPGWWKLTLVTIGLSLAVFCMALDNTIIATAIPRITDEFKSLDDIGWYGSVYLFGVCTFQLMYGKWYTFYPAKWIFLLALFFFELGSLVCGVARSSAVLILGRAIASIGAAGILTGAILIISTMVPLHQRSSYTAILISMYGIASVAGPLLGGAFTDKLTWRWCFYINLPFGAVTALALLFFFKSPPPSARHTQTMWQDRLREIDLHGTAALVPSIVSLLLALQWGGSTYPWSNWRVILCLVLFGVLFLCFVGIQIYKGDLATVAPRVFKHRTVWACAIYAACLNASFFVMIYFIPIWFQAIKEASASKSGIMNLPMVLSFVVLALISGVSITITGYYAPSMILGSVFMAVGAGLLTTFKVDTGYSEWIGYQVIFGSGIGLGFMQPLIAVQAALAPADVPIATATMLFSASLSGAIFISAAQNVFSNRFIENVESVLPESLSAGVDVESLFVQVGATELQGYLTAFVPQFKDGILKAYNDALTETWYIAVVMGSLSIVGALCVEWLSVKKRKVRMTAV